MAKKWWTAREGVMTEKGNCIPHKKLGGVSMNEMIGNEAPLYEMVSGYSGRIVSIYNICPNKIAPGISIDATKRPTKEAVLNVKEFDKKNGKARPELKAHIINKF